MKLRAGHRRTVYFAFALVAASGAVVWALAGWGEVAGEFGPEPHPYLSASLAWHGAAAMLWLVALGSLWDHLRAGWKAGYARRSGGLQVLLHVVLIASAFGLYYAGSDQLRELARLSHLIAGAVVPGLLLLHVYTARRRRRREGHPPHILVRRHGEP